MAMLDDAQELGTKGNGAARVRGHARSEIQKTAIQGTGIILVNANGVRGVHLGLTSLLFILAGCGGASVAPTPAWGAWAHRAGGIADGPEQARADRALARLGLGGPLPVCVRVLSNESLGAWTFPDGSIFVTRGLARVLDDNELAAVLAHEAGHLRAAGRLPQGVAFDGAVGSADCEERADEEGLGLLYSRGIPENSLISALQKVRSAPETSPFVRTALDARIQQLRLHCGPRPAGRELLASFPTGR